MIQTENFTINHAPNGPFIDDRKNNIRCHNPGMGIEMYINYLVLLRDKRASWKNFGYFDMGMIPIVYMPSFGSDKLKENILNLVQSKFNIKTYELPATSFLLENRGFFGGPEVWAFRKDVAEALGETDIYAVNTIELFGRCAF